MPSLFDKLNTLVNAQVNDLLDKNPKSPLARIKLKAADAEKRPRQSAQALRQRLDEALDYEDELQAKIATLQRETAEQDRQVDLALRSGDQIGARRMQSLLNMKQQQLTIAESELRDHRLLTQHLLQEMSTVEMALANQDRRDEPPAAPAVESDNNSLIGSVTDKLDEARAGLESLISSSPTPKPAQRYKRFDVLLDEEPDPRSPKPRKSDKARMDARLSRLRKPGDDSDSA